MIKVVMIYENIFSNVILLLSISYDADWLNNEIMNFYMYERKSVKIVIIISFK